jgi:hypothetical protein
MIIADASWLENLKLGDIKKNYFDVPSERATLDKGPRSKVQ